MGIFLNLYVSGSVTAEAWVKAYDATLPLIKAFPLIDISEQTPKGRNITCYVKTQEKDIPHSQYALLREERLKNLSLRGWVLTRCSFWGAAPVCSMIRTNALTENTILCGGIKPKAILTISCL